MLVLVLGAITMVALAGLGVRWVLKYRGSAARISWREYAIGMAISPVVAALVAWAGWAMSRNNHLSFNEYWNGWEIQAAKTAIPCSKDGPCSWEYDCDPYLCNPHSCNCVCTSRDKNGSCVSESCQTCYDTCYHACPYVTTEYTFEVASTVGNFTIAAHVFPENPQAYRWRRGVAVPQSVINRAGTGEPPFWVAARSRCESGTPGPVTARREYVNYILASEHTLMKEHSSDIANYQVRKLLPSLSRSVHSFYRADKVHFVGMQLPDQRTWQTALEYLNANLGREMQGDLHVVIVKDDVVSRNPERYGLALKAYWQDKNVFGHDSLSKNSVVIVVGTEDGATISWSRAFTGMPLGNEKFIVVMRDGLKGMQLAAEALIGPAISRRVAKGVQFPPDGAYGPIQRLLWGVDDFATKFKRVSMSGKDGQGGFLYLKNEIQPSTGEMWGIFLATFLASCGVWVWAALHFDPSEK